MTAADHTNTIRDALENPELWKGSVMQFAALAALVAQVEAAEKRAADLERALWVMGNESYPAAIQRAEREKFRADHYADQMNVQRQRAEAAEAARDRANTTALQRGDALEAAEAERDRLREALEITILAAGDDAPLAQIEAALATDRTEAQPENTSQYCVCGHILGSPECCNFEDAHP